MPSLSIPSYSSRSSMPVSSKTPNTITHTWSNWNEPDIIHSAKWPTVREATSREASWTSRWPAASLQCHRMRVSLPDVTRMQVSELLSQKWRLWTKRIHDRGFSRGSSDRKGLRLLREDGVNFVFIGREGLSCPSCLACCTLISRSKPIITCAAYFGRMDQSRKHASCFE